MCGPSVPTRFQLFNALKVLDLNSDGQISVAIFVGCLILYDAIQIFLASDCRICSLRFLTKNVTVKYLLETQG